MWNNHRYPHVYVGDCDHVQPLVGAGTRTRSQTGLRFHKPNATVCVIKWIWQIRKRWSLHKTNNIVNINYIHTYRELSYSQNDLITAARARLSLGLDNVWRHALSDSDGGHKLSEPTCSIVYATYYIHMAWISDYTYATYETNIQGRKWAITTPQCVLYRTIFYSVWRR